MHGAVRQVLWCMGACDELVRLGMIGGPIQLHDKGTAAWDQVQASGYRPSDEDIKVFVKSVLKVTDEEKSRPICILMRHVGTGEIYEGGSDDDPQV